MGLSACLNQYEHLAIVGEAADGIEAVSKAKALLPDIALLDIDMPNMSGLIATEVLRKELEQVKVLILSMHQSSDYMLRTLQSGARGYVLKDASTEELVKAIESVDAGETFFSPGITRLALSGRCWRWLPKVSATRTSPASWASASAPWKLIASTSCANSTSTMWRG